MDETGMGIKIIADGVVAARSFKTASTVAGIKYKDRQDMAMVHSQEPCRSAGTLTTDIVKTALVKWGKNQMTSGVPTWAVVISTGIISACTEEEGIRYCGQTAETAALVLGIPTKSVLVASIGVIDMQLPMNRITAGVKAVVLLLGGSLESGTGASMVIMTTGTENREVAVWSELRGTTVTIGSMCKGSGVIHPNMYTTLGFATTGAAISKELPQEVLNQDIQDTYNMISVGGDTPTNDIVLLLANGLVGNKEVTEKNEDCHTFCRALRIVNETLAKKMASDGEGCTALFKVKVVRVETKKQAKILAKSVICSSLTKVAILGHDANWDRIFYAMGYSGARFDPEKVDLLFESAAGRMQIIRDGTVVDYSEEQVIRTLSEPEVTAVADIKMGDAKTATWGCGLTFDYVKINVDYRS